MFLDAVSSAGHRRGGVSGFGSTLEHRKYLWMLDPALTSESPGKLVATDSGPHSRRF